MSSSVSFKNFNPIERVITTGYSMPPVVRSLSRFDVFGFIPVPVHRGGRRFGGYLSLFATICVAAAVVAYAVTSVNRFLYENTSIAVTTSFVNDPLTATLPGVTVTMPNIADPRYFTLTLEARTKQLASSSSTKVPIKPTVIDNGTLMVLNATVPLRGNCLLQDCAYFRIKVFPCINATTGPATCASESDIDLQLQNFYFRVALNLTDGPLPLRFVRDISLALTFSSKIEFYLDKKTVVNKADLLNSFEPESSTTLTNGQMVYTIDRLPRQLTDNTEMCKVDIGLSGVLVTETHNKQTSLDLIGQIFAFFGALLAIGAQIFTRLNKYAFYHHFPGWDHVGDAPFGNTTTAAAAASVGACDDDDDDELSGGTARHTTFVPMPSVDGHGDEPMVPLIESTATIKTKKQHGHPAATPQISELL